MIYTVTFNPCIDYIVRLDQVNLGEINRVVYEEVLEGGKGINVSTVLHNLGLDNTALGFISGFTGHQIKAGLEKRGCTTDFIEIEQGMTRINVKIKAQEETEINGQGPDIEQCHIDELFAKLDKLKEGDILVLAGSIPDTLPCDIYEKIMEFLQEKRIEIAVDATKDLLVNVLKYTPFLIKPNNHELGEIFGVTLQTEEEIISYGKKLQERGARNVLISMAGDGAIFLGEDGTVLKSPAPKGTLVNSVGAGDSMVAGFITGYLESHSYEKAFKTGIAAGSASAFSPYLATKEEVKKLMEEM